MHGCSDVLVVQWLCFSYSVVRDMTCVRNSRAQQETRLVRPCVMFVLHGTLPWERINELVDPMAGMGNHGEMQETRRNKMNLLFGKSELL